MIVKDKKQYIAPQTKYAELDGEVLFASSTDFLSAGGDNDLDGAPTTAESRDGWGTMDWDNVW